MTDSRRIASRELVMRVNQGLIEDKRADVETLPRYVVHSVRTTQFTREQLLKSFANARRRVAETA